MNQEKLHYFKKRLEDELALTQNELKSMATTDERSAEGWSATAGTVDESATQQDEIADRIEELEENQSEVREISTHQKNIERALKKITDDTYGICEISGEQIEEDRLEVNPSARTSKAHMEEEKNLDV